MARKRLNVFSLAFLDAMTCGFGAVILFFMIINANVDQRRTVILDDLSAEVDRMELKVLTGRKNLVQLKQDLAELIEQWAVLRGMRQEIVSEVQQTESEFSIMTADTESQTEIIERLRSDLEQLQAETERLSAASITPDDAGNRIRSFIGDGNRQYLTGLRMGGERVVVLVDASSSMLDRTIVNIIRRRNMPLQQQINSPKWQQVVNTVDWLTTQIPPGTQFQVIAFNDTAWSLIEGTDGEWLTVRDGAQLEEAVQALRNMAPSGPTSLHMAFEAMRPLDPKPDNIYLLVDGLPTIGEVIPIKAGVTGRERMGHFNRAVRDLPFNVPVNIILYAMEGDPQAAPAYWWLALRTGGSMMAPSEDWP
ncbi:MAG: VWA domain-containing protein [Gammaproteobacteria bacterium]|nr:VWA domain-containing protein [Gammaproteobacteria bacterium]MDH3506922.1 VWA domain-containing protein [Gammaproteobacteria bacterium]